MTTRAKITPTERAEAELVELTRSIIVDLATTVVLPEEAETALRNNLEELIRKAQAVVLARLKTRAYDVSESHRNSGGGEAIDAESDAWDDAVQAADPEIYDVFWMREWKP